MNGSMIVCFHSFLPRHLAAVCKWKRKTKGAQHRTDSLKNMHIFILLLISFFPFFHCDSLLTVFGSGNSIHGTTTMAFRFTNTCINAPARKWLSIWTTVKRTAQVNYSHFNLQHLLRCQPFSHSPLCEQPQCIEKKTYLRRMRLLYLRNIHTISTAYNQRIFSAKLISSTW